MILGIFFLAVIIRFLFFPDNIYFGFDQARDAFEALSIAHGNLKTIGPSTSFEGLFHGVAYYYLIAPILFLFNGSPEALSIFMRLLNACGVFVVFYLGYVLFSRRAGFFAAILYAFSFEQTQFSIYMGNPSPAVLSVGLMYLGLALLIFRKKPWGLVLATFCLGLSIQFQFALFYLIVPLVLMLIYFRKEIFKTPKKYFIYSLVSLILATSTFILGELKYNFKTLSGLLNLAGSGKEKDLGVIIETFGFKISRIINFNLAGDLIPPILIGTILLGFLIWSFKKDKSNRKVFVFLSIWFFSLLATDLISGGTKNLANNVPLFYPNIGVSISLLLFISYLLNKARFFGVAILILIVLLNINLIFKLNPKGTISEINVQQGMLLSDQKKVLDYIYSDSKGEKFAVKAVTMPFLINTTWSYLFSWFGQNKYGYVPIWNGKNAVGYPGNLVVEEAQEKLPQKRYLIIEPTRGIHEYTVNDFLKEENIFTKVVEEKKIGEFIVQKREKF